MGFGRPARGHTTAIEMSADRVFGACRLRTGVLALVPLTLCLALALLVPVATADTSATPAEVCPPTPAAPAPGAEPGPPTPLPAAIPAPSQVILACVGGTPINGATVDHWATVARKSGASPEEVGGHRAKGHEPTVHEVITEVMGFLISSDWVMGEASRLGISLSEAAVKRSFDHTRDEQFPHRREFRKFLRQSGQTIGDLLLRVRLNLLSSEIQKRVTASAQSPKDKQQALREFVKTFKATWQAQTVCVPAFAVPDCGSNQEPL